MVGELAMGRFRILERLGSGGMGTVYRAFDERLQRFVAVKEIPGVEDRRILREAQAVARLNHPGIVTLYELGSVNGSAVLVSELVDGATLAELAHSGALSDREVGEVGADISAALDHAHGRGVVHRDLKPQNVIVRADDGGGCRAKLMDFGIASLSGAPTLTATGEVVGTIAYMAPEQAVGDDVREPADVYSLALTLYECWAGTNPVARTNPAETALAIGEPVPSLAEYRPDLPSVVIDGIDASLDHRPGRRPGAGELHRCLQAALNGLDDAHSLPAPRDDPREPALGRLRTAQLAALCAWGLAVTLIAAGLGHPGTALVLGLLSAPAVLVASPLAWAALPLLAPLLGAVGLAPVYPVLAGARGHPLERAVLGALGWWCMLASAATAGTGPRLDLVGRAAPGWSRSTGEAATSVIGPLVSVESLLGAATFALAAVALGAILRVRHLAVALLGVLLWAAALEGSLRLLAGGALAGRGALIAAAAAATAAVEFRQRPRSMGGRTRIGRVRSQLAGGEPAAQA